MENFVPFDSVSEDFMEEVNKLEWSEDFVTKYMLLFLKRQTRKLYFVASTKKKYIFDFFLKSFELS